MASARLVVGSQTASMLAMGRARSPSSMLDTGADTVSCPFADPAAGRGVCWLCAAGGGGGVGAGAGGASVPRPRWEGAGEAEAALSCGCVSALLVCLLLSLVLRWAEGTEPLAAWRRRANSACAFGLMLPLLPLLSCCCRFSRRVGLSSLLLFSLASSLCLPQSRATLLLLLLL